MDNQANVVVSTDFTEGQIVRCPNPDQFTYERRNFLRDRTGTVVKVWSANLDAEKGKHSGHINKVSVLWHKKKGRGKESRLLMNPHHIEVVPNETIRSS